MSVKKAPDRKPRNPRELDAFVEGKRHSEPAEAKEKLTPIMVRVSSREADALKAAAEERFMSVSAFIRASLAKHLKAEGIWPEG